MANASGSSESSAEEDSQEVIINYLFEKVFFLHHICFCSSIVIIAFVWVLGLYCAPFCAKLSWQFFVARIQGGFLKLLR